MKYPKYFLLLSIQRLGYGIWLIPVFIGSMLVTSTFGLAITGILIWVPVFFAIVTRKKFSCKYLFSREIVIFLLLLTYAALSLLWSPFDKPIFLVKEMVRIATCIGFVLYFSILVESDNFDQLERYIRSLIKLSFMLGGCYLIYANQLLTEVWQGRSLHELQGLITTPGLFFHHSPIAWLFAMVIVLIISGRFKVGYYQSVFDFFLFVVSVVILLIAQSRGAYLGLLVGVITYGALGSGVEFKRYILGACLLILVFFLLYVFADIPIISTLVERGASDRFEIWKHAIDTAKENPVFGFGFGSQSIFKTELIYIMHFHSGIFSTLYYGGGVGVFFLVLLVILVLQKNATMKINRTWASIFLLSLTVFSFDGNHLFNYFSAEFYIFVLPILILVGNRIWNERKSYAEQ